MSPKQLRELVMKDDPLTPAEKKSLKDKVQAAIKDKTPISLVKRKMAFDDGEKLTLEQIDMPAPTQQRPYQQLDTGAVETQAELDTERAAAQGIKALTCADDIEHLTELDDRDIPLLMSMRMQASMFNMPLFDEISDSYETLKISKGRKGRREIIDALMARIKPEEDKKGLDALIGKLR